MPYFSKKIDYSGGSHGNFLELAVNGWIEQVPFDRNRPFFYSSNGACHTKHEFEDYQPVVKALHWSGYRIPLHHEDKVIQIIIPPQYALIILLNTWVRSGDDANSNRLGELASLDIDTTAKLSSAKKYQYLLYQLQIVNGPSDSYTRREIRDAFFTVFSNDDYVNSMNIFDPTPASVYKINMHTMYNIEDFYTELNNIAEFLGKTFLPDQDLIRIYHEFLKYNIGLKSYHRCKTIVEAILANQQVEIDLNVIEEAWINHRLSSIFNMGSYVIPELAADQFPVDSLVIAQALTRQVDRRR